MLTRGGRSFFWSVVRIKPSTSESRLASQSTAASCGWMTGRGRSVGGTIFPDTPEDSWRNRWVKHETVLWFTHNSNTHRRQKSDFFFVFLSAHVDPCFMFVSAEVAQEGEVCGCEWQRALDELQQHRHRQDGQDEPRHLKHRRKSDSANMKLKTLLILKAAVCLCLCNVF